MTTVKKLKEPTKEIKCRSRGCKTMIDKDGCNDGLCDPHIDEVYGCDQCWSVSDED